MLTPIKKPQHRDLLDWEKEFNTQINKIRYIGEQAIANFKPGASCIPATVDHSRLSRRPSRPSYPYISMRSREWASLFFALVIVVLTAGVFVYVGRTLSAVLPVIILSRVNPVLLLVILLLIIMGAFQLLVLGKVDQAFRTQLSGYVAGAWIVGGTMSAARRICRLWWARLRTVSSVAGVTVFVRATDGLLGDRYRS